MKNLTQQKGGFEVRPTFVGGPWTSNPETWPGVQRIDGGSNHYLYNSKTLDPPNMSITESPGGFVGGRKKRRKSRKVKRKEQRKKKSRKSRKAKSRKSRKPRKSRKSRK